MNQDKPLKIHPENLAIDTKLFIGARQIACILVEGYYLPVLFFKSERERKVFDVLVNGYLHLCEEIYDAIKENDACKRSD